MDAVSFKEPSEEDFSPKHQFLECSYSIADIAFQEKVAASGLLRALKSTKYESFACDIGPICPTRRVYSKNGFPRAVPAGEPVPDDVYLKRATGNSKWLRHHFGGHIQVENLNYFPTGGYERVCEPDFIRRVTEVAEVGLLLDLAHCVISAHYLGYKDPLLYLEQLPLERGREIHLSHAGELNDVFEDLHEAPGELEFIALDALIDKGCPLEYLTVEYYEDPESVYIVYQQLAWRINGNGPARTGR